MGKIEFSFLLHHRIIYSKWYIVRLLPDEAQAERKKVTRNRTDKKSFNIFSPTYIYIYIGYISRTQYSPPLHWKHDTSMCCECIQCKGCSIFYAQRTHTWGNEIFHIGVEEPTELIAQDNLTLTQLLDYQPTNKYSLSFSNLVPYEVDSH